MEALKSVANIGKPYEKVIVDALKLFMGISDKINFLQMGRFGHSFISSKDFIAECFNGYGSIYQLMRRRRRFGAMSNIFGFGRKEQHLSFQTYFNYGKGTVVKARELLLSGYYSSCQKYLSG